MRREHPCLAEVAGSAYDALSEVVLPDAINHDAGRQRIVFRSDPFSEVPSPPARLCLRRRLGETRLRPGGHGQHAGAHNGSLGARIAPMEEVRRQRIATLFGDGSRGWIQLRPTGVQLLDTRLDLLEFSEILCRHPREDVGALDLIVERFDLSGVEALPGVPLLLGCFPCRPVVRRVRVKFGLEEKFPVGLL